MKLNHCYLGDCREGMRDLIAAGVKVQTIITSPPYWGLRDYGVAGQIGMEATLQEFVATMVEVFDLARDLLADDGTLWLNLGDSYASVGGPGWQGKNGQRADRRFTLQRDSVALRAASRKPVDLKPKDMCGVPWRVAFALQDAGWYLRQDIIWSKPNPMPESVRDRCTKAHEYLFLLTKSQKYFFDQEAILEPCSEATHARLAQNVQDQIGSERANGGAKTNGNMKAVSRGPGNVNPPKGQIAYEAGDERHRTKSGLLVYAEKYRKLAAAGSGTKNNPSFDAAMAIMPAKRNRRSVWTIPTESFSGAHFATFPRALVEPCILAGTSSHGHCPVCGARVRRVTEPTVKVEHTGETSSAYPKGSTANRLAMLRQAARERGGEYSGARVTTGFAAGCDCGVAAIPDIVFDPFMGSGTVAQVAQRLGRKWLGTELNPAYIELQDARTQQFGLELG